MTDVLLVSDPAPGVRELTLNRPERRNAIDGTLAQALVEQIRDVSAAGSEVRVVVLDGAGPAFCAGADLKWLAEGTLSDHAAHLRFQDALAEICSSMETSPAVFIGAAHGFALAGGLEMFEACDIRVVAQDAQLGDEHIKRNLIAGAGGTQRLPRAIGTSRALYHLLSGERLIGQAAVDCGLAARAVPAQTLRAEAIALATRIGAYDGQALAHTKRAVRRGIELPLSEGLELERWLQFRYRNVSSGMDDGVAGFAAADGPGARR